MEEKKHNEKWVSEYLWLRILKRMKAHGISARKLARLIGHTNHSAVNRLVQRSSKQVDFIPEIRKTLKIPESELDEHYMTYRSFVIDQLSHVMCGSQMNVESYMAVIKEISSCYRRLAENEIELHENEFASKALQASDDDDDAALQRQLDAYEALKLEQSKLVKLKISWEQKAGVDRNVGAFQKGK